MTADWKGYAPKKFFHYIATWCPKKQMDLSKGGIPLLSGEDLSPALQEILDPANTTYIHGLEGPLMEGVFEAILEREANARFRYGNNAETINMFSKLNILHYCKIGPQDRLRWRMLKEASDGWVGLIRHVFNRPRLDALATLANMLGTKIENLQTPTNKYDSAKGIGYCRPEDDVPTHLYLPHLTTGHSYAQLMNRADILAHSGQLIGAILQYSLDGQTFCLPATVDKGRLCIGIYRPIACLLNQHLIDKYPGSTILFCQDMRTALSIQKLFGEVRGYDPSQFIVTAHLGTDLSILPWNYLHGHDVVFIPAPSKVSLSRVRLYKEYISGAHATSFRVYPGFLLHSPPGTDLALARENLPSMEAALLRDTMVINDMDMPLREVQRTIEKAISYESFIKWGQDLEFFRKPKESVSPGARSEVQPLPPADPSEKPSPPQKLGDVVLHHFIRPGTSVEILGSKNAGKTQFALSICAALRQNGYLCSIFRNAAQTLCNVAYIDAETLPDEFQENLKQYQLDNDAGFFGLCKFDKETNNLFPTISLMNQEFREGLRNFLLGKKCRYVVLDNLTALMGNRVDYGDAAQEVIEWVELLQNDGICTIFIHHLGGDYQGKARGSKIFTIRARTIITLTGKNEILRNPDVTEPIKTSARQDGLTVGLRFDTCKTGALLEGKVFYAHLPFGASHWEYLGAYGSDSQGIKLHAAERGLPSEDDTNVTPTEGTLHDPLKSLSPVQREVFKILQVGTANRANIQKQLNWGEEKVRRVLNELKDIKVVRQEGNGKNTYYALND